ncbi:MAG TPA: penicillin acylase family protein [Alphaproteobacteria bacterium]|nr:penicillin acylase family protein [Alphaproteobacteria bacterium]
MRRFLRWALRLGLGGLLALALIGLTGYLWLRGSLPETEGSLELAGLNGPVEIARDEFGIPFIRAESAEDALFAMGFVHAQDRLWQMEVQRRTGQGRLSEVFGARTLKADKFLRALGIARAAEAGWAHLDEATRRAFKAYAAGVNAELKSRSGPLPLPFLLLGVEPEPWRPIDSLIWIKMMAWDLGGSWRQEWLRARLAKRLGPARARELFPGYPADGPLLLPELPPLAELLPAALRGQSPAGLGSNAWVLASRLSEEGAPLLANDPHLSLEAPSQWYLASLAWPGQSVAGATLPGVPLPVLGRNERIAWGFTNTNPDVQDLFVERVDRKNPARYLTPEGSRPFAVREEVIGVKDAEPVTLSVRETRHGPVISDLFESRPGLSEDEVLAFAWTALLPDDATARAGLRLAQASNWAEFVAALEDLHAPQMTVLYADVDGNIGVYAAGRVPIRSGGDGSLPSPGWNGGHDWQGFIPFDRLPHAFNPPSGQIVSANQRLTGDAYPYFLTHDWAPPYRARRIERLLADHRPQSAVSFLDIQTDIRSEMAAELTPLLLALAMPEDDAQRWAVGELEDWTYVMAAERPEPLIFAAWQRALVRALFADELGDDFAEFWSPRPLLVVRVLRHDEPWCDDIATPETESCRAIVTRSLAEALADLSARYGERRAAWRWGMAHRAVMREPVLAEIPFVGSWFTIDRPSDGGNFTVNVAGYEMREDAEPFAQRTAPGYRAIYDLSDSAVFQAVQNMGQSENPFSPHYADLVPYWELNRPVRVRLHGPAEGAEVLRLVPEGPGADTP